MSITNGYATLAEIKARLGIPTADTADDTVLEAVIEAASRAIDNETGRVFYATTATKYFRADDGDLLFIPDLLSVTTLKTDSDGDRTYETTWATTDYDLEPYNDAPYTRIRLTPSGRYSFPTHAKGVEIAGSWGYNATGSYPDAINEACLILASRLFKRKDAPFGVAGTAEMGQLRIGKTDPDVAGLLYPYRHFEVA